ncbi:MAG: hypothetical protein ABR521_06535 [Gaiellaceae bacterium]
MDGLIVAGLILAVSLLVSAWVCWRIARVFRSLGLFGHLRLARTAMKQLEQAGSAGGVLDQKTVEGIVSQLRAAGVQLEAETLRRGTIVTDPAPAARVDGVEEAAARALGSEARATVLDFRDLNVVAGSDTLAELKLRVEPHGRESYEVLHNAVVPRERLMGLVRGERVTVRVDPDEPGRLAIDWARS